MLVTLPLAAFILLLLICRTHEPSWRGAALSAAVVWGLLLVLMTEGLSLFHALATGWLAAFWTLTTLGLGVWYWSRLRGGHALPAVTIKRLPLPSALLLGGVGLIVATTGFIALIGPPNNWDSMTYHMSRVAQWAQNRTVGHYPTHMTTQLQRGPWAEFAVLHLQLLSGGDRFANLVQWFSMVGSVVGVSLIAKQLGADGRGQILAAVATSTLPMGILEASTTQTDYACGFWLVCLVHFLLLLDRLAEAPYQSRWSWLAGASLGLAILTKATAYFYAFPFVVWCIVRALYTQRTRWWRILLPLALIPLTVNLCLYLRNLDLFGSPIGFVKETCAGCSYPLEEFSVGLAASNALRNIAIHLGTPIGAVNEAVEQGIRHIHGWLGVDVNDPRSTWPVGRFQVHPPTYNENVDGNPLHLLLMAMALTLVMVAPRFRQSHQLRYYAIALVTGFLFFSSYVKWQVNHSRLHLALFVLWSPVVGLVLAGLRRQWLGNTLGAALLVAALPWLLLNMYHPLLGERTILNTNRLSLYFLNPKVEASYRGAVQFVADHRCSQIGLIRGFNDLEYPLWVLFTEREGSPVRIQHIEVTNESAILSAIEPFRSFSPCATVSIQGGLLTVSLIKGGQRLEGPEQ